MTLRIALLALLTACTGSTITDTATYTDRDAWLQDQLTEEQCRLEAQCNGEYYASRDCETRANARSHGGCDFDEYWASECLTDLAATECNKDQGFERPGSCDLVWDCTGGDGDDFGH